MSETKAKALVYYESQIRETGTTVPNAFLAGFSNGWDAAKADLPSRDDLPEKIMDALNSLWVANDMVLGKLHARDEILALLRGGE